MHEERLVELGVQVLIRDMLVVGPGEHEFCRNRFLQVILFCLVVTTVRQRCLLGFAPVSYSLEAFQGSRHCDIELRLDTGLRDPSYAVVPRLMLSVAFGALVTVVLVRNLHS